MAHLTPLSKPLMSWLTRALQLEVGTAFQSPHEAQVAFESVLASDRDYVTSSKALDEWVTSVGAADRSVARRRAGPAIAGRPRAPEHPLRRRGEPGEHLAEAPPAR